MTKTKQPKKPGDFLIQIGSMLVLLAVILFVLALVGGGSGNPTLLFGLVTVGLIVAILGYVKRGANR